jgi:predicted nucleic acid-binding protein
VARSRRLTQARSSRRLILDSGAVIALSRNDARARAVLTAAWEAGAMMAIPSVVIAETVRGSARDAAVNRVIKSVGDITDIDEGTGRTAGGLLGRARSDSTIDALVVASAISAGGGVIVTGDRNDLTSLSSGHPEVIVHAL